MPSGIAHSSPTGLSEILPRSSMSWTSTSIVSPTLTASSTFARRLPLPSFEMWIRPSRPGHEVHERAERRRVHDGAGEVLADRDRTRVRDLVDDPDGLVRARALASADEDRAVVLDVDVGAGEGDDLVDPLALGPDDLADLVDRDLDRDDPRRLRVDLGARRRDRREHHVEDLEPGLLRLLERAGEDVARETGDLHVELDRGHHVLRPGDLEVHVAERVLRAEDVRQRHERAALGDHPHRDARDGRLDRHPGVHQRQASRRTRSPSTSSRSSRRTSETSRSA